MDIYAEDILNITKYLLISLTFRYGKLFKGFLCGLPLTACKLKISNHNPRFTVVLWSDKNQVGVYILLK